MARSRPAFNMFRASERPLTNPSAMSERARASQRVRGKSRLGGAWRGCTEPVSVSWGEGLPGWMARVGWPRAEPLCCTWGRLASAPAGSGDETCAIKRAACAVPRTYYGAQRTTKGKQHRHGYVQCTAHCSTRWRGLCRGPRSRSSDRPELWLVGELWLVHAAGGPPPLDKLCPVLPATTTVVGSVRSQQASSWRRPCTVMNAAPATAVSSAMHGSLTLRENEQTDSPR